MIEHQDFLGKLSSGRKASDYEIRDQLQYERFNENQYPDYPPWTIPFTFHATVTTLQKMNHLGALKDFYKSQRDKLFTSLNVEGAYGQVPLAVQINHETTILDLIDKYCSAHGLHELGIEIEARMRYSWLNSTPKRKCSRYQGLATIMLLR